MVTTGLYCTVSEIKEKIAEFSKKHHVFDTPVRGSPWIFERAIRIQKTSEYEENVDMCIHLDTVPASDGKTW